LPVSRMVQIDEELLRKRAEHNDRCLANLEEISLHQQNIEGINRLIHALCPRSSFIFSPGPALGARLPCRASMAVASR
jgi:hypothetical protein